MSADSIRMGKAYLELDAQTSPLKQTLRNASRDVKAFGSQVQQVSANMAGAFKMILPELQQLGPACGLVSMGLNLINIGIEKIFTGIKKYSMDLLKNPFLAAIRKFPNWKRRCRKF